MVIKSNPGLPALDMESVLLLEKGAKTLDKVFDVIGHLYTWSGSTVSPQD